MITDLMRDATAEHEIYFLLTAYIETARSEKRLEFLPVAATALPLDDLTDVRFRFTTLMNALDAASRNLDDQACLVLREAVFVYGSALHCLAELERRQRTRLAA
jgi:hypothetical protein